MSEAKLQAARAYIESGDYVAAKAILETMLENHTAQRWLRRLGEKLPDETSTQALSFTPHEYPNLFGEETFPQAPPHQQPERSYPRRWEYCVVGSISHIASNGRMDTHDTVLIHFSSTGSHRTQSKIELATMIAQLGDEGWEMVTAGTGLALTTLSGTSGVPGHVLYFKRPLRG